jgi:hypothetical protein
MMQAGAGNGSQGQAKLVGASLPYAHALRAVEAMRLDRGSFESMQKLFGVLVSELTDLRDERSFDVQYVEPFFIAVRDVALHLSFSDCSGIFLNAA